MKNISIFPLFMFAALLFTSGPSFAGEPKEIELNDGSVLRGEVVSLSSGVYTIRTEAMGTVTVKDSSVRVIRSKRAAQSALSADHAAQIQSLQQHMLADQDILSQIGSLQNDPSFQKVLEDPEIMRAVAAGDIAALMASPKFMEVLNNSTVKNIQQKLAK